MDNPEEAGIGRRRRAPLRSEAVGRLQNAAGGRRRYVQSRRKYATPLCRKREKPPKGADVARGTTFAMQTPHLWRGSVAAQLD